MQILASRPLIRKSQKDTVPSTLWSFWPKYYSRTGQQAPTVSLSKVMLPFALIHLKDIVTVLQTRDGRADHIWQGQALQYDVTSTMVWKSKAFVNIFHYLGWRLLLAPGNVNMYDLHIAKAWKTQTCDRTSAFHEFMQCLPTCSVGFHTNCHLI